MQTHLLPLTALQEDWELFHSLPSMLNPQVLQRFTENLTTRRLSFLATGLVLAIPKVPFFLVFPPASSLPDGHACEPTGMPLC